jgi:hypothetical protein
MNELQKELLDTYPQRDEEDVFGRRPATPREIRDTVSMRVVPDGNNFPNLLEGFPPTELDIRQKGDDRIKKSRMRRVTKSGRR